MIRISTLFTLSILFSLSVFGQRVYVDNGSNASYTLRAGDSLSITAGVFRGQISNWEQGAKIYIAEGAEFAPSNFGYFLGEIIVNGKATLPGLDGQSNRFKLKNFGRIVINGSVYMGNNARLENSFGATIEFKNAIDFNKVDLTNNGIIKTNGNLYIGNGSKFNNNNIIEVGGHLEFNNTSVKNYGKVATDGKLTMSGGSFENNCMTTADEGIFINNTNLENNGLVWATTQGNNSRIVNGGTIDGEAGSVIMSHDFENNGNIKGSGYYYFTGETRQNSGQVGTNGNNGDQIIVFDATRSNSNTIFDYQSGQVRRSVVFQQFSQPQTSSAYPACGTAFRSEVILPIRWNFFTVSLTNQLPSLQWGAEQDNGTLFEIERSYDGINFSSIHSFVAVNAENKFSYNDNSVNASAAIAYYRIRAVEPTGAVKISETRSVRFSMQSNLKVQASPNPFNNNFTLSFKAERSEKLTLRVINLAGQQQFAKTITASNGFNSISVAEAANLSRGLYLVQLTNETGVIATEKIVKQ